MSLPLPNDWDIEEPPDFYFPEANLAEPPDWVFNTTLPIEPPDFSLPEDEGVEPYAPPPIPLAQDYAVPEEVYAAEPLELPAEIYAAQGINPPASEGVRIERDSTWRLQHSGILIEEVLADAAEPDHYAVGVVEVWQDPQTGDQTGAYLHMADAPHLERAEEMRRNIYHLADEAGVSDPELGDFAHGLIKQRGEWQPLTDAQWEVALAAQTAAPDMPDFQDDPQGAWAARDQLLAQVFEVSGDELERAEIDQPHELQTVMHGLGFQVEDFDPANTPPPLFDENTNTAYWIGVYQPDPTNPNEAITSMLSIQPGDDGQPIAHLAPVATGDWDHAYRTAEYLLKVAERTQDIEQVLDTAEAMAVATQQRELWGIPVEEDIAFSPVEMELN